MAIATCIYTADALVESSDALAELLGYASRDRMVGLPHERFLPPDEVERWIRSGRHLGSGQWSFTARLLRADGSTVLASGFVVHVPEEGVWVCTLWEGPDLPEALRARETVPELGVRRGDLVVLHPSDAEALVVRPVSLRSVLERLERFLPVGGPAPGAASRPEEQSDPDARGNGGPPVSPVRSPLRLLR